MPDFTDTVIVGNGPSALILSFILHGNIPYYDPTHRHPDPILHQKLLKLHSLLDFDILDLTAHFAASRLSYSTQALPVNVLFDTLLRPLADTDPGQYQSCVKWRHEPERSIPHLVLGNTLKPGGQWADNPIAGSWDIGALSYAEMLSLPGYSLTEHRWSKEHGKRPIDRPTRRDVAEYLAFYPEKVGISDAIRTNTMVKGIAQTSKGFYIESHDIRCKHLVLASGTFSNLIPARPLLQPLLTLSPPPSSDAPPLLVVGSGFTAADVILSAPPNQRIIHIYKWAPDDHPSPLRACHPRAYPEYASVYRKMKIAAKARLGEQGVISPMRRTKSNPYEQEKWLELYEGLPNTYITDVKMRDESATITLQGSDGSLFDREISAMQYVIGRRGSLEYLDESIRCEILGAEHATKDVPIAGKTLRGQAEESLEIAPNIFITGSLTGDSLIRFAFGGCVFAAREITSRTSHQMRHHPATKVSQQNTPPNALPSPRDSTKTIKDTKHEYVYTNGHASLGDDVKSRAMSIDIESRRCELWKESGWWSGGCIVL